MMSDAESKSPIPWGLVEHVRRTSTGRTTMQISLPIELRARMLVSQPQFSRWS